MPNWIEGTFKARGKIEDLLKWLNLGLCRIDQKEFEFKVDEKFSEEIVQNIKNDSKFYIKGTRRSFVNYDYFFINKDQEQILVFSYKSAWSIRTEELAEISKEFNISFKVFGIEKGVEFTQDVEISKGKILIDNVREYLNWKWECPFPNMGG